MEWIFIICGIYHYNYSYFFVFYKYEKPGVNKGDLYLILAKRNWGLILSGVVTSAFILPILGISFGELEYILILDINLILFVFLYILSYEKFYKKNYLSLILFVIFFSFVWILAVSSGIKTNSDIEIKTGVIISNMLKTLGNIIFLLSIPTAILFLKELIVRKKNGESIKIIMWLRLSIKLILDMIFVSLLLFIAYFIFLFVYILVYKINESTFELALLGIFFIDVCRSFFEALSLNNIWTYPVVMLAGVITILVLVDEGVRWASKIILRALSIQIEEQIPRITKKEKYQNIVIGLLIIPAILFVIPSLTAILKAKDQKEFLIVQNVPVSIASPIPDWIVLHEDKDFYIVAEYKEDNKVVDVYNEAQTIIPKENITVYKKIFDEVNRKEGPKPKGGSTRTSNRVT